MKTLCHIHSGPKSRRPVRPVRFSGFMLLEVMAALLIFSIGILGIVGLQANSTKQSSDAQYRSMASMLASDLVSKMWLSNRTATTLQSYFGTSGTGYNSWNTTVAASGLPNAATYPPTVSFSTVAGGGTSPVSSTLVTVVICWRAPSDPAPSSTVCDANTSNGLHKYVLLAQMK